MDAKRRLAAAMTGLAFVSVAALVAALALGDAPTDQDHDREGPRVASSDACAFTGQQKAPLWDGVGEDVRHWAKAPAVATPGVDLGRLVGDAAPAVELVAADPGEPRFLGASGDFVRVERVARAQLEVPLAHFGQPVQVAAPLRARAASSTAVFGRGVLVKYQHPGRAPLYLFNDGTAVDGPARMKLPGEELKQLLETFARAGFEDLPGVDPVAGWGEPGVTLACARLQKVPLLQQGLAPVVDAFEALHARLDARVVTHVYARRGRDLRVGVWPREAPSLDDLADGYVNAASVSRALRARLAAQDVSYFAARGRLFRVRNAPAAPLVVERCSEASDAPCRMWPADARAAVDLREALVEGGARVGLPARRGLDAALAQATPGTFLQGTTEYRVEWTRAEIDVPVERPAVDERPAPSAADAAVFAPVVALAAADAGPGPALVRLAAACADVPACAGECAGGYRRFGTGEERAADAFLACPRLAHARVDDPLPRSVDERVAASIAAFLGRLPATPGLPRVLALLEATASRPTRTASPADPRAAPR